MQIADFFVKLLNLYFVLYRFFLRNKDKLYIGAWKVTNKERDRQVKRQYDK